MKKSLLTMSMFLIAIAIIGLSSCKKDKTPPSPNASFTLTGNYMKAPVEVSFNNTSTNAVSYAWSFGNDSTSTDVNPKTNYTEKGSYTVSLTAKNEDGKTNVSTKTVKVYGNITSWSPVRLALFKDAWKDEDDDIEIYLSVWNSSNNLYDYTGDNTFISYAISSTTNSINFNISNEMSLAMTPTSKFTLKFQLYMGGAHVNPNIDPIVYQKVINGSDVLPTNAAGPYLPKFEDGQKLSVDIKWKD